MFLEATVVPLPILPDYSHVTACCQLFRVANDLNYQHGPLGSLIKQLFLTYSFKKQKNILQDIINLTNVTQYNDLTVRIQYLFSIETNFT